MALAYHHYCTPTEYKVQKNYFACIQQEDLSMRLKKKVIIRTNEYKQNYVAENSNNLGDPKVNTTQV